MSLAGDETRELVKKARAEVLAACINATCVLCRTEKPYLMWFGGKNWKGRYQAWVHDVKLEGHIEVQTCPADAIHKLQPATKALEELLRKERKLGWNSGVVAGKLEEHITQHINDDPSCIKDPCIWRIESEARLEKAHAILEKP